MQQVFAAAQFQLDDTFEYHRRIYVSDDGRIYNISKGKFYRSYCSYDGDKNNLARLNVEEDIAFNVFYTRLKTVVLFIT